MTAACEYWIDAWEGRKRRRRKKASRWRSGAEEAVRLPFDSINSLLSFTKKGARSVSLGGVRGRNQGWFHRWVGRNKSKAESIN